MIVAVEKQLTNVRSKPSPIFGNEYFFDFFGPEIDVSKFSYISVLDCYMETGITSNNLVTLCSSLIDKSSANPNREIFKFFIGKKKSAHYDKPTHAEKYKLQCFDLKESVFTFSFLEEVKNIKFRLRLEFTKCLTDSASL